MDTLSPNLYVDFAVFSVSELFWNKTHLRELEDLKTALKIKFFKSSSDCLIE